jgi:hypothetical protein
MTLEILENDTIHAFRQFGLSRAALLHTIVVALTWVRKYAEAVASKLNVGLMNATELLGGPKPGCIVS